jgi:hypothetical protein
MLSSTQFLARKLFGGVFHQEVDTETDGATIILPFNTAVDLPDLVTITIEGGDKLNGE